MTDITFQTPDEAAAWSAIVTQLVGCYEKDEDALSRADAMIIERRKRMAPEKVEREWIAHTPGDPMPCDGETLVVYKLTDGLERKTKAGRLNWLHVTEASRIVAWRPA
ncbi:MAG: hypothetical protein ING71_17410 [Rhodocyclaceae bacterium]|nr:hypothetical protein [Rhodocyclaceae bacterium]